MQGLLDHDDFKGKYGGAIIDRANTRMFMARIACRAHMTVMDNELSGAPTPPGATVLGYLDHADWYEISGWGFDPRTPDTALWLEVVVDDGPPAAFLANLFRPDLSEAGYGDGRFGFRLRFPTPLDPMQPHSISVRRRDDATLLMNAPVRLARAPRASEEARAAFEQAISSEIAGTQDAEDVEATTGFLLGQVDRLLQARADTASGAAALQHFRLRWSDFLEGGRAEPPVPDQRSWVLLIDEDLPDTQASLALVQAMQAMGHRVAVVALRELATQGATAKSLAAMDVTVHGMPAHFTVEDVLRRHRRLYRAVLLRGAQAAAGYAVLARQHQPRARIVALIGDAVRDRADPLLHLGAALLADVVLVESEEQAKRVRGQLAGRTVLVLPPGAPVPGVLAVLSESGVPSPRPPA